MFAVKLQANLVVASDCFIVFEHNWFSNFTFDISHVSSGINYNWSLLKAVNVLAIFLFSVQTNQSKLLTFKN